MIDGANAFQQFRWVTIPSLRHVMAFVYIYGIIGSYQVFDQIYVMTNGGPIHSTSTVVHYLFTKFWDLRLGYASAIAVVLAAGGACGLVSGELVARFRMQPFIATLAGMWFARGMCYVISDSEIRIYDPTWKVLAGTKVLIPGMAADLVVFDPETVRPVPEDVVHDFPNDGWRMRELAEGIHYTVVNGEVLLEKGTHTGTHPGRVLHNARFQSR